MTDESVRIHRIKALATIAVALAVLGMFIVALGGHRFWESLDRYVVRFDTVQDLRPGRPVKFAGLNVGRVLEIGLDDQVKGRVKVVIGVEEGLALYEGTVASISQKGLVGDNYVLLTLSGDAGEQLADGSEIPSVGTASMAQVAVKMGRLLDELSPRIVRVTDALETFLNEDNAQHLAQVLADMPEMVASARTTLEQVRADWRVVSRSAVQGIEQGRTALDEVSTGMEATLAEINKALIKSSESLEQTLVTVRTEVSRAGGRVDALAADAEEMLDYDQENLELLLENLNEMSKDMRLLSRSLRERPWQIIHKPQERPIR